MIFCFPANAQARVNITDWYIKDFQSEIVVNLDSSLTITERILADCGNLPNKHGIYRVVPTFYQYSASQSVKTPVKLISITDFQGKTYNYQTIKDNKSVTWKIGDSDITVKGENGYVIKYAVANAVRFNNPNFDEFYWNLNGNFWDIETDSFEAKIIFPVDLKSQSEVNLYSGKFDQKNASLADYRWLDNKTIQVNSNQTLHIGEGITLSATTPKNVFSPYVPGFWETYGQYFFLFLPILFFVMAFLIWAKHGRDPKVRGPVVPEFSIPENLLPMEMGVLAANGRLSGKDISAAIVNLAVSGHLIIKQTSKKNYKLTLTDKVLSDLNETDKLLIEKLFEGKKEVQIDDLKYKFYEKIPALQQNIADKLKTQNLYQPPKWVAMLWLILVAMLCFGLIFAVHPLGWVAVASLIVSDLILTVFLFLMPRRTLRGAQTMKKVEGFKLYLKTAERYRQEFNEKENIFEKYLPYAMVFGIVGLWTKVFAQLYQEVYHKDFFATYHPFWYSSLVGSTFDIDTFSSNLESMTTSMASTIASSPSSSGSGGGGFSGGGGGGGGGGGW